MCKVATSTRARAAYVACGSSSTALLLNEASHADLAEALESVASMLDPDHLPRAIVCISPQWQTDEIVVTSSMEPGFGHDYPELQTEYGGLPCPPGAPDVADQILKLLKGGGINCSADQQVKLADAVVGPTSLMFPLADVPVVSMSILASLSVKDHLRIGSLLQPLCQDNVFFLGVGFSSNSFCHLQVAGDPLILAAAKPFKEHLDRAVCSQEGSKASKSLVDWDTMPGAQFNHENEEHLLPLMVVSAASGSARATQIETSFLGVPLSNYVFE